MNINFALALNKNDLFEKNNFGEAEKFVIYQYDGNKMSRIYDLKNPFKTVAMETKEDVKRKGEGIIKFLKEHKVSVIASGQFGENIRMINKYFIPVIIFGEKPQQVIDLLFKYIHWVQDELHNQSKRYKLFTIKNGILKTTIDQE